MGPDFIDPGHHRALTGRISRNLDSWMLKDEFNRRVFARGCRGGDVAVVEGVMGLYDGFSGTSEAGSTAQMAKLLGLPVILVVDARSMARSAAAIVQGFENFDPDLTFAGVIFSKTGSPRHYEYLKEAVESTCSMPCLGHMPRNEKIVLPERHLGLVTTDEHLLSPQVIRELISMVEKNTRISQLVRELPDVVSADEDVDETGSPDSFVSPSIFPGGTGSGAGSPAGQSSSPETAPISIAVARDKAFCFYYQENLEILEGAGANITFFSPLEDDHLPPGIQGIYFGGGYPELFGEELSANSTLLAEVREKSLDGMPIYGECGGFMYLCASLTNADADKRYPMTGCFPFSVTMSGRLRALGYREISVKHDTLVGREGEVLRGHEFHYSALEEPLPQEPSIDRVYEVAKRGSKGVFADGYQKDNTLGSYLHIHFGSMEKAGQRFVDACRGYIKAGSI